MTVKPTDKLLKAVSALSDKPGVDIPKVLPNLQSYCEALEAIGKMSIRAQETHKEYLALKTTWQKMMSVLQKLSADYMKAEKSNDAGLRILQAKAKAGNFEKEVKMLKDGLDEVYVAFGDYVKIFEEVENAKCFG
jgi:hypothetical protein